MATRRPPEPQKIILAVDGSEHALAATKLVHSLPLPPGSAITVLAVLTGSHAERHATLLALLERTAALLKTSTATVNTGLLHGSPAQTLTHYADDHPPDLIVVGARGLRATLGILLGGVAQQIVEYARWPVLVVRAPCCELRKILLVTDGSPSSQVALDYLARFPFPAEARLTLMHVLPPLQPLEIALQNWPTGAEVLPVVPRQQFDPESLRHLQEKEEEQGQALLDQNAAQLSSAGLAPETVLLRGDAATQIIEYVKSNGIDLIVSGSRGLGAVSGWLLGSVSRKLVHYAPCSVLVTRGRGKATI